MSVTPSDLDIQRAAMQAELGDVHTAMPAEVLRVHAGEHGRQFVDVQPSLQRRAPNEDGVMVDETLPVIPMVPVGYMQGGGFFVSMPLAAGDFVLLVFAERSLDQWLQTARKGSQRAINPGDMGTHSLEGAVALPCGPAPRSALLAGVHETDLVIGHVTGSRIQITKDGYVLTGGTTDHDFVALAAKVDKIIADLHSVFTGWTVVPQDGGAALKTKYATVFATAPASVAASKLKAT